MKTLCATFLAGAALFISAPQLRADFVATASLNPGTDRATNSHGSGTAAVDYNMANNDFTYTLSWANLTGNATMAHIHYGGVGVDGPIVIPFFMMTMPGTDTIMGTLTQADVTPVAGISTIADVAAAIESGNAYVNIHTAAYLNGELRGQLAASSSSTPEPETTGLMFLSLASGVIFAVRRQRSV